MLIGSASRYPGQLGGLQILGVTVAVATIVNMLYLTTAVTAHGFPYTAGNSLSINGHTFTSVAMTAGAASNTKGAPESDLIAYTDSGLYRTEEIFVVDPDGTNLQRLTYNGQYVRNPVWSPDGTRIAYTQSDSRGGSGGEISVMNADGTNHRRLTHRGGSEPSWSGDGTRIAYTRGGAIYTVAVDGTDERQLTRGGGSAPVWSPDGTRIAYTDREYVGGRIPWRSDIYVIDVDGTNRWHLTTDGNGADPDWSPDSTRIAYTLNGNIYVVNTDSSKRRQVTHNRFRSSLHRGPENPRWSPDGTRIAYTLNGKIYTMDSDGSNKAQLTDSSTVYNPRWSPDGTSIAYTSPGEIRVMNADGTGQQLLIESAVSPPVWSPDGTRIIFTGCR